MYLCIILCTPWDQGGHIITPVGEETLSGFMYVFMEQNALMIVDIYCLYYKQS